VIIGINFVIIGINFVIIGFKTICFFYIKKILNFKILKIFKMPAATRQGYFTFQNYQVKMIP